MAIGPEETAWVRTEFPLVPTFLTSAMTGQGVEDAFSTIVSRTVDAVVANGKKSQSGRLLRQRILLFIADREERGASKNELFADFKQMPPAQIMEELDHLVRLGALFVEESGPDAFVKAPTSPHVSVSGHGPRQADRGESDGRGARDRRNRVTVHPRT